jgi:predicted neuraminidase
MFRKTGSQLSPVNRGLYLVSTGLLPAVWMFACVTSAWGQQAAIVSSQYIYEKAPFPECHASTLVMAPNGKLVAAWFGGTEEGNDDVEIWFSSHDKDTKSWAAPSRVADGVYEGKRYPCWNPILVAQGQELILFYKVGPSPSTWWGMWKKSKDSGSTWSSAQRLPENILGPIKNKPILLKDGSWLCGSSSEHDGWRAHVEIVGADLSNWKFIGPLNKKNETESIQPTFLRLKDDSILMLCRTKTAQKISMTLSKDQGQTWDKLSLIDLPNPNSGIDAVTLKDGRHLLLYNHTVRDPNRRGADRAQLNLAVSSDGIHWSAVAQLENEEKGEFSYPAIIQGNDGLVHATYTWNRQKVRYTVLDPQKIKGVPIQDAKWPSDASVLLKP